MLLSDVPQQMSGELVLYPGSHAALAQPFPPDARYLHAPRALLEVLVGGQPIVCDGRIYFVQLTPLRLLCRRR